MSGSPKGRKILLSFLLVSIVFTSIVLICAYEGSTSLLLCSLDSDTPLFQCDNPSFDKGAFRVNVVVVVSETIIFILADGMLYYRAVIIWQRNIWCICIAGVLLIGSEGYQIAAQILSFEPGTSLNIEAASFWLTAGYDIITSSLIIGKLISHRYNAKVTEREESIGLYTSPVAIFFEASLLYSSSRILYAALLVTGKGYLYGYWPEILVDVAAATSPLFIILRLALNSFKDPYKTPGPARHHVDVESSIVFAQPDPPAGTSGILRSILLGTTRSETTRSGANVPIQSSTRMPVKTDGSTLPPDIVPADARELNDQNEKYEDDDDDTARRGREHKLQIESLN